METFITEKKLVNNPDFVKQKEKCLSGLTDDMIDRPILNLVNKLNRLSFCFTLQSCYGHFVYEGQNEPANLEPLPSISDIEKVEYRIAYLALCLENSESGKTFLQELKGLEQIDPQNIQFGSAVWFWQRQINSYAIQVEPDRYKTRDSVIIDYQEALRIEKTRNEFYKHLRICLNKYFTEN